MNKVPFSDPEARRLFLRYAAPCAEDTEEIKKDIEGHLSLDLEDSFPTAISSLKVMAKEKNEEEINKNLVRKYFWFKHADIIQQNTEANEEEIHKCLVLPGKMIDKEKADLVNSEVRKVNTDLVDEVKKGDRVTVHYDYVAERIKKRDEEDIKQYLVKLSLI